MNPLLQYLIVGLLLSLFSLPGSAQKNDEEKVVDLPEVTVNKKKEKYSKRNPAVDLIQQIQSRIDDYNPEKLAGYNYDFYEKSVIGLNDVPDLKSVHGVPVGRRQKLVQLFDTAAWTGKRVLDLAIKEQAGYRIAISGNTMKEVITARQSDGIDKSFDTDITATFFKDILREINLYGNDIRFLHNTFVSPLSGIGSNFYKYEILDTVLVDNEKCIELTFVPFNAESTGFNGRLFIPINDSIKYVKRAFLRLPKASNVNYIKDMIISQNYERDSIGKVHKVMDDVTMDIQLMPGTPRFYILRQNRRDNFNYQPSEIKLESLDKALPISGTEFLIAEADNRLPEYWTNIRTIPLSVAEHNLLREESPFKTDKLFYWLNKLMIIVIKGYIPTSDKSKFDIGPVNSLLSHTDAGGWRLQLGGMTTVNLSPHIFFRGYGAYGFGDKKWKYGAQAEYSFNKKKYGALEFPRNSIMVSYNYDMDQIGQEKTWDGGASLIGSLTRIDNNRITYRRFASIEYVKEWNNNLSLSASLNYERQEATEWIEFVDAAGNKTYNFSRGYARIGLRYAPGERFVHNADTRMRTNKDGWVFSLTQEYGPKGLFNSQYNYVYTKLGIEKRFWFSAFGYLDVKLKTGKVWTQVPFTELCWMNSNISYFMSDDSFSLLNPMEFAMDSFGAWNLEYHLNGLLLNRIPFVKKARLREVVNFKGFVGHLADINNPQKNPDLFRFPDTETIAMGKTPYMEISIGLENILSFLRIDYVWRLTYRDRPSISKGGVRVGFHFTF